MTCIDGFVCAVPDENRAAYQKHAEEAAKLFKAHGALSVVEAWGVDVPEGKLTSFHKAVQRKEGESIVFAWITWPSREARDAAWARLMEDPEMANMSTMPFDGKRMIYGAFEAIVQA
jgi:uncharacterized protein YbaA (DUF1428 family)